MGELDRALKTAKMGAMGPDLIHYAMLKHLPNPMKCHLLDLYNHCFQTGTIPQIWKASSLIPLLKPNKPPSSPESYRPIALSSCTLKLLEKMIAARLTHYLETNNLIPPVQSGFRKGRGCEEALDSLVTDIQVATAKGEFTICTFMDIKRAFDWVRHEAVLAALRKLNVTGLLYDFCSSYLRDRVLHMTVGGSTATLHMTMGVPQGGPLSAHLFSVVMCNVPPPPSPQVVPGLYADDTKIHSSHKVLSTAVNYTNEALDILHTNAKYWGVDFDPKKSKVMIFCAPKRRPYLPPINITYAGTRLPVVESHRFLGLVFDSSLSWKAHIATLVKTCEPRLNLLRCVSSKTWGNRQLTLLQLYLTLIRSVITYGLTIYGQCSPTLFYQVEKIQSKALRIILGLPRSTSIAAMEIMANIPPLRFHLQRLQAQTTVKQTARRDLDILPLLLRELTPRWPVGFPPTTAGLSHLKDVEAASILHHLEPLPRIPNLPPWTICPFNINMDWCQDRKDTEIPDILKAQAMQHIETASQQRLAIFTDGALDPNTGNNGIGIACPDRNIEITRKLHPGMSIFSVELNAIWMAICWATRTGHTRLLIITDSQSALKAIQANNQQYFIIRQLYSLANLLDVLFLWVPSHVGIPGNERADQLASRALHNNDLQPLGRIPFCEATTILKKAFNTSWTKAWTMDTKGRQLFEIHQQPGQRKQYDPLPRRLQCTVNALSCNRILLNNFLFLLQRVPSPNCTHCGVPESSAHFLLECSKYINQRSLLLKTLQTLRLPLTMCNMLGGATISPADHSKVFLALHGYVNTTIGFKTLLGR